MILEAVSVGAMQVNCYILASTFGSSAIIIDPGDQADKIQRVLDKHKLKPALIINTHGHYDHIGCDNKFAVPVYIHREDLALLKDPELNLSSLFSLDYQVKSRIKTLKHEDIIELDDIRLKVLHIPGHTPGGITLLMQKPKENIAFTGDTLFFQGIGRSDFTGGDGELLIKSIKEKLMVLPEDTVIYPGHGPSSTIGREKRSNSFVN
ncbi:MAG: MBL fold metallo-hydrolase [Candidatus Omnitrophota bacterium]